MKDKRTSFTKEEMEAMRERAKELKKQNSRDANEKEVLEKISQMPEQDRKMAIRIHEIIKLNAPKLSPKTWYGMPAYAKGEKIVCFFQSAHKFKARYATFGFNDTANLDAGNMWATSFALKKLTLKEEKQIIDLVKKSIN